MYPDPKSFEAKKLTVHMCFVRYINKRCECLCFDLDVDVCFTNASRILLRILAMVHSKDFPELDPLSVKALGISLYPNLKNCLKQGGNTSLYARICEFLGTPRVNNPMSAQSVILQSGDPLIMRWLYRIDEEDQNDMYGLSSTLHHYMDTLQKVRRIILFGHAFCRLCSDSTSITA